MTNFHILQKNFNNSFLKMGEKVVSKKVKFNSEKKVKIRENKAGYTATPVACRWAGAVFEVT